MTYQITVNTQHGAGGGWSTDLALNAGPINLMRAWRHPGSGQRGVGGYHTNLQVGDIVIDPLELRDLTLAKARDILKDPGRYAA